MWGERRIGTWNGLLLAAYFIPAWFGSALKIWASPIRGLYDRSNVAVAIFASDYLDLSALSNVRLAWLLALAKVTVIVFMAVFVVLSLRKSWRDAGNGEEALSIALILGTCLSFVTMVFASKVGEAEALRLHATESMLLLGGVIVLLVQPSGTGVRASEAAIESSAGVQPLSSPSS